MGRPLAQSHAALVPAQQLLGLQQALAQAGAMQGHLAVGAAAAVAAACLHSYWQASAAGQNCYQGLQTSTARPGQVLYVLVYFTKPQHSGSWLCDKAWPSHCSRDICTLRSLHGTDAVHTVFSAYFSHARF